MFLLQNLQAAQANYLNGNSSFEGKNGVSSISLLDLGDSSSSSGQPQKLLVGQMEICLVLLYCAVCLTGLISNTSLISVILGKRVHRTPKNLYVLNLGISGISTCIICIPPTLTQCLYGGKWFLGLVACKLVPTMQGTNILVSTGTITAIALDRWNSITQSIGGNPQQVTHKKVAAINAFIWISSFILTSPILIFQDIDVVRLPWETYSMCVEVWPYPVMKHVFTIVLLLIQYILPMVVLPIVHWKIMSFLERNSSLALDSRRQERERKRNKRMTFLLSCIALTFALSSLPLHLFFTITDLGLLQISNLKVYFFSLGLCHVIAMSSCVSNPVLYGWLNTNLRKEFLKVLPPWLSRWTNKHPRSSGSIGPVSNTGCTPLIKNCDASHC